MCSLAVDAEADSVSDEDVDLAIVVVVDAVAERKLATGRSVTAVFVPVSGSERGLEVTSCLALTDEADENRLVPPFPAAALEFCSLSCWSLFG